MTAFLRKRLSLFCGCGTEGSLSPPTVDDGEGDPTRVIALLAFMAQVVDAPKNEFISLNARDEWEDLCLFAEPEAEESQFAFTCN
jgi:hypothetical protein